MHSPTKYRLIQPESMEFYWGDDNQEGKDYCCNEEDESIVGQVPNKEKKSQTTDVQPQEKESANVEPLIDIFDHDNTPSNEIEGTIPICC